MKLFKNHKKLKKGQLKNIEVDLVSLLFDDMKPANGKGYVAKCEGKNYNLKGSSVKIKSDDAGLVFVTVYEPDTKDSEGDFASAEEIRKACEHFSKHGMIMKNDVNHNETPVKDAYVVENYILKTEDKEHFPNTKIGSWVQVIKFDTNSELWKKVKAGKFNGVSLYGKAEDDAAATLEATKAMLMKTIEDLKSHKNENTAIAIKELEKQIAELDEKASQTNIEKKIKSIENGFENLMTTINKAINTQIQGEHTPSDTETEVIVGDSKIIMKSAKKDLYKALSDVDSGSKMNVLTANLQEQFVDLVVDFSPDDVFSDISVVELGKDEKIDLGLIREIILYNSKNPSNSDPESVYGHERACPTEILTGELRLTQDIVEFYKDKKGEEAFGAFVEQKLAQKIKKAVKRLLFLGNKNSTNLHLKGMRGVVTYLEQEAGTHMIPIGTKSTYGHIINQCLKSFTNDALGEIDNFKIYCSPKTLLDIQDEIASRKTPLGDRFVIRNDKIYFKGMEVKPRFLEDDTFIIGIPKHIILGYRTDALLKIEHTTKNLWAWLWSVRVRFGITISNDELVRLFKTYTE